MPKRSNEFQRMISLLHRQLHHFARVTESAMVPDRLGGEAQEIDVLIEESIGQIEMRIGVECRDHGRPATIEWVQQMRSKHEFRTDKLVLVSRSGFSKNALSEAKRFGIETMSLTDAHKADWNIVVNRLKEVFVAKFPFHVERGFAVLAEEYGIIDDPEIGPQEYLFDGNDNRVGTVDEIAIDAIRQPEAGKQLMEFFHKNPDRSQVNATFSLPVGHYLVDTQRVKRRIRAIKLEIQCRTSATPVPLNHGAVGKANVAWGKAQSDTDDLFLVVTEREGEPRRATIRFREIGTNDEQYLDLASIT